MMNDNTLIKVRNRDNGSVGYTIPDMNNLHRDFASGETKEVTMGELRQLHWLKGGKKLLKEYLVIENDEAVAELLGTVEPEYNYTEADIKELLLHGSLDAFLDCLDYAPEGVISIIKKMAVELELNDVQKRDAILKATGFNVTSAISINKIDAEGREEEENVVKQRRVQQPAAAATEPVSQRRTAAPAPTSKYKVVSTEE